MFPFVCIDRIFHCEKTFPVFFWQKTCKPLSTRDVTILDFYNMTVVAKNVQGSDAVAISIELFDLFFKIKFV